MRYNIWTILFLLFMLMVLGRFFEVYLYVESLYVFYQWPIDVLLLFAEDVESISLYLGNYDEYDEFVVSLFGAGLFYGFIFVVFLILSGLMTKPVTLSATDYFQNQ